MNLVCNRVSTMIGVSGAYLELIRIEPLSLFVHEGIEQPLACPPRQGSARKSREADWSREPGPAAGGETPETLVKFSQCLRIHPAWFCLRLRRHHEPVDAVSDGCACQ